MPGPPFQTGVADPILVQSQSDQRYAQIGVGPIANRPIIPAPTNTWWFDTTTPGLVYFFNGNGWNTLAFSPQGAFVLPITTKGDLFVFGSTYARLGVSGVNGRILSENSLLPLGLEWIDPPSGGGGVVLSVAGRTGNVVLGYVDISGLAAVAHSGDYNDLINKPTIPTTGMILIQTIVASASPATVTFSSIPGVYTNLKLFATTRDTQAGTNSAVIRLAVNGDFNPSNYGNTARIGSSNGVAFANAASSTLNGGFVGENPQNGNTAGIYGAMEVSLMHYLSANFNRRVHSIAGVNDAANSSAVVICSFRYLGSTSPITSVTITTEGTGFLNGSQFDLFGC